MNMKWIVVPVVLIASAMALGQEGGGPSVTAKPILRENTEPVGLSGRRLLNYVRCQLGLTAEQNAKYTEMLAQYVKETKESAAADPEALAKIAEVTVRLEEARNAKDEAKVKALHDELDRLTPQRKSSIEFLDRVEPLLDDAQKQTMAIVRQKLAESVPFDLRMKPRQVVRLLESMGLSKEQSAKLLALQDELRTRLDQMPMNDDNYRQREAARFFVALRGLLTAEQTAKLDAGTGGRIPKVVPPEDMPANGWDGTQKQTSIPVKLERAGGGKRKPDGGGE